MAISKGRQGCDVAGVVLFLLFLLFFFPVEPTIRAQTQPTITLDVSSYFGGSKGDWVRDVAFDTAGNFYIVGGSEWPGVPYTHAILNSGAKESTAVQEMNVFVAKFSRSGQHQWTSIVGGPNYDRAYAVEVDADGYIYVAGRAGAGFPVSAGAFQTAFQGGQGASFYGHQDGFVFKMAPDGRSLAWASYFGATDDGMIRDLALDSSGNVYVSSLRKAGSTYPPAIQAVFNQGPYPQAPGGSELVVAKIRNDGAQLLWAMHVSGSGDEAGESSIRVDPAGNPVVVTVTNSSNIPTTSGAYSRTLRGSNDFYVAKIRSDGSGLVFGTYLGGTKAEAVETHHLAVDAQGNAIVAAGTLSTDFPMAGAYDSSYNGSGGSGTGSGTNYPGDVVVAKLSADGRQLLASTYVGGRYGDQAEGVWLDGNGNVWIVGGTYSDNFPTTANAFQTARRGSADGFIAQLSPSLDRLLYSTYYGGSGIEYLRTAAVDPGGFVYFGGQTNSSDLPRQNALQTSPGGGTDGAFGRLAITVPNAAPAALWATPTSGEGASQSFTFAVSDANGASDLRSAQLLVNSSLVAAGSCYVRYLREENSLSLRNDAGTEWLGPIPPGVAGVLNNSQCLVNAGASSASSSGDTVTVTVALEFSPAFYGTKQVYIVGEDLALVISGWKQTGTWIPGRNEPPAAVSATPSSGQGLTQVFQFSVSDPNTSADLRSAQVVINSSLSAANGCYLMYRPAERTLWLREDAGQNWLGPLTPQLPGTIGNSQCTVDAGASAASLSTGGMALSLALTFSASFYGAKNVYLLAEDRGFANSGWQLRGTWVPSQNQAPAAVSVTPSSGQGLQQVFQFVTSDPNGADDLRGARFLVHQALSASGGCYLMYRPVERVFWLRDDGNTNWLGPAAIATAGTLANSQCILNAAASTASKSGNQLTVAAALTFQSGFIGAKNLYGLAEDKNGVQSGWQTLGSWRPAENQPPRVESVTPSSGEGMAQVFQLTLSDPNGATDIRSGHMLINSQLSPAAACYARYQPASGLWLRNDTGQSWLGPLPPGSVETLSNSQCQVGLASSPPASTGELLSISLAVEFLPTFSGVKNIYLLAEDSGYLNSGWQNSGSWKVSAAPRVIHVPAGGNLQQAIDQAQPGDTITLEPAAVYSGNFILRRKTGSDFITLTSADQASLPPPNTRITPGAAGPLPKIISPNNAAVFSTEAGAHHYRLVGLEIAAAPGIYTFELLSLGSPTAAAAEEQASDIDLDRLYLRGDPVAGGKRAITLNSGATAIRNCWIAGFRSTSQETQAIGGWNGPGPFTIVNNHLEAAGSAIHLGGAAARIAGLIPADIVIGGNHFYKPPDWKTGGWAARNLLVVQNARRLLVEGNLFEHNWAGADSGGFAILFAVRTQNGSMPWAAIEDVTLRRNIVRAAAAAIRIEAKDSTGGGAVKRVLIQDNLLYDIDHDQWGGEGRVFDVAGGPEDVTIDHNTCLQLPAGRHLLGLEGAAAVRFTFTNNIAEHGQLGVTGANQAIGTATLDAYAPGYSFQKNALIHGQAAQYPTGNFFPPDPAAVGFVDAANDDYRLAGASPYAGAGTDGKDLGADVNAVLAATQGAGNGG